jgi:hypothetical protein
MKFHLAATITNAVLIFGIMYLYDSIRTAMDAMYFFRTEAAFESCFSFLMFIFSWSSTFIIYMVKKKSAHFYYFLCYNILGLIIFRVYEYISFMNFHSTQIEVSVLLISLKDAILETIIPIFLVSACVALAQNIIGKKLLPTRYQKQG